MPETSVVFESGGRRLVGLLQMPFEGAVRERWLFAYPLFEERKSSQRVLVTMGRALAASGRAVLLFDYRGCGDSEGDFEAFSLPHWQADLRAAADWLAARFPHARPGILGLRLGATLAWREAARPEKPFDRVVLWSPVVNGQVYLVAELRRKVMKEMLTFGAGQSRRDDLVRKLQAGESVDFDGYAVSPSLFRDLAEWEITPPFLSVPPEGAIIGLTPQARPDPALVRWAEAWQQAEGRCTLQFLAEPPFWSLIGLVPCTALIRTTRFWITGETG